MTLKNVKYLTSAANGGGILIDERMQVAVSGKSNSGKSSFINMLANHGGLARVSGAPGRTRMVNYFSAEAVIGGQAVPFLITDLPGYGFAKAPKEQQAAWGPLMDAYFTKTEKKHVFILMDIRHLPSPDDLRLINYLYTKAVPFSVVANKSDKQSKMQNQRLKKQIAESLKVGEKNILVVSCLKKTGKEDVFEVMGQAISQAQVQEQE